MTLMELMEPMELLEANSNLCASLLLNRNTTASTQRCTVACSLSERGWNEALVLLHRHGNKHYIS